RLGEERTGAERALLAVEVTGEAREAAPVERAEVIRVRLPRATGPVHVVEGVPDLMAHHIRGRGRPRADDDFAFAVCARAGVPGRPARGQWNPVQAAHVVQVGHATG